MAYNPNKVRAGMLIGKHKGMWVVSLSRGLDYSFESLSKAKSFLREHHGCIINPYGFVQFREDNGRIKEV